MSKEEAQAIAIATEYAEIFQGRFIASGRKCKDSYEAAQEWYEVAARMARIAVKEPKKIER
jgi:hypothetical protein